MEVLETIRLSTVCSVFFFFQDELGLMGKSFSDKSGKKTTNLKTSYKKTLDSTACDISASCYMIRDQEPVILRAVWCISWKCEGS